MSIVVMKEDLTDKDALADDKQLLVVLDKSCATRMLNEKSAQRRGHRN